LPHEAAVSFVRSSLELLMLKKRKKGGETCGGRKRASTKLRLVAINFDADKVTKKKRGGGFDGKKKKKKKGDGERVERPPVF